MNKHILFVMRNLDNSELFTQEQKEANKKSAAAAAYADGSAAYSAVWATYFAAADTADDTTYDTTYDNAAECWVNKFFERSGEDKQTYIDEINKMLRG